MLFQKKIDKSMEWLKNKSKNEKNKDLDQDIDFDEHYDPKAEWDEENSGLDIQKGDILPLILSGLLVFSPLIIIVFLILLWTMS